MQKSNQNQNVEVKNHELNLTVISQLTENSINRYTTIISF